MHLTQRTRTPVAVVLLASLALGSTTALAAADQSDSTDPAWLSVRRLASGTPVTVTLQGLQARERHAVSADESSVTVLNTDDSTLPSDVRQTLRAVAVNHPEYLSGAASGNTFVLNRSVRLQRDGVFLDGVRLATLSQILETSARRDVGEIAMRQRGRGVWGHFGPLGGYFVGAMAGGLTLGLVCRAARGTDRCDTGAFLAGGMIGGVAGGTYGFHAARRETEVVVYRSTR